MFLRLFPRSSLPSHVYQDVKGIVGRGNIDQRRVQWQLNLHFLGSLKRKTTPKDKIYQAGVSKLGCDSHYLNLKNVKGGSEEFI